MYRFLIIPVLMCLATAVSADWPQFRGNNGNAVTDSSVPTSWSMDGENIAWKIDLPGRGPSSPIVIGDKVIVTCSSGAKQDQMHVLCFSAADGKQLWERNFWATGRTFSHKSSANAAPTPASDGNLIFAFFSSNDLVCLDLEGNLQWYRGLAFDFPKAGNDIGMSSSPVLANNTVIVQVENQGQSFSAGIDVVDGKTRWQVARDPQASWSSPVLLPTESESSSIVLLQSPAGLTALEAYSGEELWRFKAETSTIPSTIATKDRIFFPSEGTLSLKVEDPRKEPEVEWSSNKLSPTAGSSVLGNGKIYSVNRVGALTCANAETGESLWGLRMKGPFWASPVLAAGHLYCFSQSGEAFVVDVRGEKGEIVSTIEFGETLQATPAVSNHAMYVRSDKHLWKIAE
ncbi:MAG: outer membrane protein assembly factor BamB family protein [Pirellulales bacterium]